MAYVVTAACIGVKDRACMDVCPIDCIWTEEEDRLVFIDPQECIDCGACEAACPVSAIYLGDEVPSNLQHFISLNALYMQNKEAVRLELARLYPD